MVRPTLTAGRLPELRPLVEKAVLMHVSKAFCVSVSQLKGKRRDAKTAEARQVAMWLLREVSSASFFDIATILRRADHGTARHACAVIEARRQADTEFARKLDGLRFRLGILAHGGVGGDAVFRMVGSDDEGDK